MAGEGECGSEALPKRCFMGLGEACAPSQVSLHGVAPSIGNTVFAAGKLLQAFLTLKGGNHVRPMRPMV